MIRKYESVFSKDEDDIGYCDLVEQRIITLDKPVKVPPSYSMTASME